MIVPISALKEHMTESEDKYLHGFAARYCNSTGRTNYGITRLYNIEEVLYHLKRRINSREMLRNYKNKKEILEILIVKVEKILKENKEKK